MPIVFFSVFATIFAGSSTRATTRRVPVAVVDEDRSETARRFVAGLKAEEGLKVVEARESEGGPGAPYTAATAEAAVKSGEFPVALIVPKGFGEKPIRFGPSGERPRLTILSDPYAAGFYERNGARLIGEAPSDAIPGRSLPLYEIKLD